MVDKTGDGLLGASYYKQGHVVFKRSYLRWLLTSLLSFVALAGGVFIGLVLLGAILNINVAHNVIEMIIAGIK